MRCAIILATALTTTSAVTAQADTWCGFAAKPKSLIQCGYSSAADCETAIGKGGTCFLAPDYALNTKHATPVGRIKLSAARS